MPGKVEVIDLTEDGLESVESVGSTPSNTQPAAKRVKYTAALGDANKKAHGKFWERMRSGPQQHGPRRMRNIGAPRLGDVCPFLELPAEVRNRIYEYALGGHNLHMFALDYQNSYSRPDWSVTPYTYTYTDGERQTREWFYFQYSICKCPESDAETYENSVTCYENITKYFTSDASPRAPLKCDETAHYLNRHANCLNVSQWFHRKTPFRERPTRLGMGLLRTCKQVHDEACLVPYYDDTFSFASGKDIDVFVNAVLQPKQREALQHLHYTVDNRPFLAGSNRGFSLGIKPRMVPKYDDYRILCGLHQSTIDMLVGLQSLDISFEDNNYSCCFNEHSPRFPKGDLTIRAVIRNRYPYSEISRKTAMKLEFGLSRSVADVKDQSDAFKQLAAIHGGGTSNHIAFQAISTLAPRLRRRDGSKWLDQLENQYG